MLDFHSFVPSDVEKRVSNFMPATRSTLTDFTKKLTTGRPEGRLEPTPWPRPLA